MFKQIDQKDYPTIKSFVNQYKYKVSVNSILDCNTKGEVFADDELNPTIVVLWDKSILVQIFGEIEVSKFNIGFKGLIDDYLAPSCAKSNGKGLLIGFFPQDHWVPVSNQIIEENYLLKCFRWPGELDEQRYREFKSKFNQTLPGGYQLCRVDQEILEAEQNKEFKDEALASWSEMSDFLTKGFGFCIIKDNKVIASAVSCGVADKKYYEISIDTFDEQERKKGLATQCAIAYIDHCLANNSLPHWGTDYDNPESQNLATKIGFIGSINENRYQFRFNRADNYLVNTYFHFIDNDKDYINTAINKAFENEKQLPIPRFIYKCAEKLTEKGFQDQAIRLLNEYLKIDKSSLQAVKDNANFLLLHDTPEWKELLKKYEE